MFRFYCILYHISELCKSYRQALQSSPTPPTMHKHPQSIIKRIIIIRIISWAINSTTRSGRVSRQSDNSILLSKYYVFKHTFKTPSCETRRRCVLTKTFNRRHVVISRCKRSYIDGQTYLIELDDVWMIQQLHNLNLPVDFLQVGWVQPRLVDYFDGHLSHNKDIKTY